MQSKIFTFKRLAIVVFCFAVIVTFIDFNRIKISSLWEGKLVSLRDDWDLAINDMPQGKIKLPTYINNDHLVESRITITKPLPDSIERMHNMLLRTSQKTVEVSIDGIPVYAYDASMSRRSVKIAGLMNHFIWIPKGSEGKLLTIALIPWEEKSSGTLYEVFVGTRTAAIGYLIRYDGISILFSLILIILAILSIFSSISIIKGFPIRSAALDFGFLELCAGLWIGSGTSASQLIIHNQLILLLGGMIALFLIPYFLTNFVVEMIHIEHAYPMKVISALFPVAFIIISLLQQFNVLTYFDVLPIVAVILFLLLIALCILSIGVVRTKNKDAIYFPVAVGFFVLAVLGETVLLFIPFETFTNALILNLGILAFSITLFIQLVRYGIRYVHSQAKNEYIFALAHTDSLTNIANRLAFDEKMDFLNQLGVHRHAFALFLFDVNNLKKTNDTYGHTVGDELLRATAAGLAECAKHVGQVFRIGGDEFAIVIDPCDRLSYDSLAQCLQQWSESYRDIDGLCRVACGSVFCEDPAVPIETYFKQADAAMYLQKEYQKTVIQNQERI
ncbi:MAG: diguanylate cyclase [Sphaerochaetaceae bacterium]